MSGQIALALRAALLATGILSVSLSCNLSGGTSPPLVRWYSVDGGGERGINRDFELNGHYPQLLAFHGDLYVTWYEDLPTASQIRVARLAGGRPASSWQLLDGGGPAGINRDPAQPALWSRLVAFDDRLYCYWFEHLADGTTTVRVAVHDGAAGSPSWSYVDGTLAGGLRYAVGGVADYASLEGYDGRLYAAWRETDSGQPYQIRVAVFGGDEGSPVWSFVDSGAVGGINYDAAIEAYYPKLATFDGRLYVIWYELNGLARTIHCAVYNGNDGSPGWTVVGGDTPQGLNFDHTKDAHGPQLIGVNGSLFGLWYERGADLVSHVRVSRYRGNDAMPEWDFIDGGGASGLNRDPTADAFWPRATGLGDLLFVAWTERDPDLHRVHVSVYDTTVGNWIDADGGTALSAPEAGDSEYAHLSSLGSSVFLAWSERRSGVLQVRVLRGDPR